MTVRSLSAGYDWSAHNYPGDLPREFHIPDAIPPAIQITGVDGLVVTVQVNRKEWSTMNILKLLEQWGEIIDVEMQEPDFEDIIHQVY